MASTPKNIFAAAVFSLISLTPVLGYAAATTTADVTKSSHYTVPEGCGVNLKDGSNSLTCKAWEGGSQATTMGANIATCICSPKCVQTPPNHFYYDDPVAKHKQTNENEITLPVVLAWDNVPGWQKEDGGYLWFWSGASGKQTVSSKAFGVRSYVLEIDNTHNELRDTQSAGKIFRRILTTTEFNSTIPPMYPCFFNSDTTIRWRVRPCCKEDGSYCMPEDKAVWWTFKTIPAPEPVWPKDPDWNGGGDAKNISFKDVKLKWCQARIDDSKKPYNENYSLSYSYQLRVYTNENKVVLTGQTIPAAFAKMAQWLQTDVPTVKNPLACHYLEKQTNNTCKPDVVNPIRPANVRNSETFYYWSHKEVPIDDRALFTKNLTYSWQLRRCFNNPNSGDESCATNNEKNWGQLWSFTTKDEAVAAPVVNLPENDPAYADSQTAKLTGLPGTLKWSTPDGANSFAYDIQKISGATATSLVGNERRFAKNEIFFSKNGEVSGTNNYQGFELEIDTPYKWRVKSCWPSIPVGGVCDSAWSPWYYFRTTGRAPKAASIKPAAGGNNVSLPVSLQWEAVPGAKSYILTFNGEKIVSTKNEYQIDYPKVDQNQVYSWKLQTCADETAKLCGPESPETSFMTAALGASQKPIYPDATIGNNKLTYDFTWEPVAGAHYYKVTLNYIQKSDKETNAACTTGKKMEETADKNSIAVNNATDKLFCLGKYEWSVLACMDQACTDTGAAPLNWQFDFIAAGKEIKPGETILAVCGLTNNNPNTAWDDREPCGAKHLLLAAMQLINLLLFKVSFILLPILLLATGAIFYTQFGGAELLERVKSWWKIIGVGYALLFFAWTLVGVLLMLFGYSGVWWNI